jgi:integrase
MRPNFSRIWARALAKAGMTGIHFHDLRHACNHFAAVSGASTRELMGARQRERGARLPAPTARRDLAIADSLDAMVAALKTEGSDGSGHVGGTATG